MNATRAIVVVAGMLMSASNVEAAPAPELQAVTLAGKVPAARHDPNDSRGEALCDGEGRAAESPEDKAVVAAGWIPFFAPQQAGTTRVLMAAASLDGQCRPLGLSVFVFRSGRAVGMVTARDQAAVPGARLNDASTLLVDVDYQKEGDARCCPTGKANLVVAINDSGIVGGK